MLVARCHPARWHVAVAAAVLWFAHGNTVLGNPTPASFRDEEATLSAELELYRDAIREATAAQVEYRKDLEARLRARAESEKDNVAKAVSEQQATFSAAQAKILELASAAGLAVAAIFFGFYGILIAAMPGFPRSTDTEKLVLKIYSRMAHTTAIGILLSLGCSVSATVAIAASSSFWARAAVGLGAGSILLMVVITVACEVISLRRNWSALGA